MLQTTIAIFAALGSAVCLYCGYFYQKVAVDRLPRVRLRPSWTVFKAFITNGPWLFSVALMGVAGALYALALALAPISIVQPLRGSGIALLAYLAITRLGEKPGKVDFSAIVMIIVGIILLGVSLAEGMPEKAIHDPAVLWSFIGMAVAVALFAALMSSRGTEMRQAAGMGIMVGIMFGCADLLTRLILVDLSNRWAAEGIMSLFHSVFILPFLVLTVVGFIAFQSALQRGMAVLVVTLVAALGNLIPIVGGMWALNEHLPSSPLLAALRLIGFALILVSIVILARFEA